MIEFIHRVQWNARTILLACIFALVIVECVVGAILAVWHTIHPSHPDTPNNG